MPGTISGDINSECTISRPRNVRRANTIAAGIPTSRLTTDAINATSIDSRNPAWKRSSFQALANHATV
jgi:hypothetical protein